MSPAGLIFRIFLAIIFPPLGVIDLPQVGCGTVFLLLLLTCCGFLPGQIAAIIIIAKAYDETRR